MGNRLTSGQTYTYAVTATSGGRSYSASRTYIAPGEDPAVVAARQLREVQDADFRARQDAAIAAATSESKAWNAANPGKQKCVQWGPVVHANGISTASGGVCANPVEPGPNTSVTTQAAPSVSAPTETTSSNNSASNSSSPTTTPTPTSTATTSSNNSASNSSSPTTTPTPTSTATTATTTVEFFPQWGNGTPFTRVLKGQLSTADCPSGFQSANGLIAAIGVGTFTECWPENAWIAYRLGGNIWELFKSSGGTYDAKAEETRRLKVNELKSLAKSVAQKAADETPGIQRCSNWTGYGESGQECAYTFIQPNNTSTSSNSGATNQNRTNTDSATATSSTPISSGTGSTVSTTTSVSNSSTADPFPNLKNGEEIAATRISSQPGIPQSTWESTSTYKNWSCPTGSGRASGVDLKGTVTNSDDVWFAYCVKSWTAVSATTNGTDTPSVVTVSSTAAGLSSQNASTSPSSSSTARLDSLTVTASSQSSTVSSGISSTSTSGGNSDSSNTPTLTTSAIKIQGTSNEVKQLIGKVVDSEKEQRAMVGLLSSLEKTISSTAVKNVKLPGSVSVDEKASSDTPDVCKVEGLNVLSLRKGTCVINYTVIDSDGNSFSTKKTIVFKK